MNTQEILGQLQVLGSEKMREQNIRRGAGPNQFGVKMGDIRKLAEKIKTNHELALKLWETDNLEARLLAVLLVKPKDLSVDQLENMVRSATWTQLADWLNSYVVKQHPEKESFREEWMRSEDPMLARSGWSLTADRIAKNPEGLDLKGLLDRLEREMPKAPEPAQWTMNYCLAGIGIHFPEYRDRAVAIGEKLGIYRDYPTPKGCTSPFAPIWIAAMVGRQG